MQVRDDNRLKYSIGPRDDEYKIYLEGRINRIFQGLLIVNKIKSKLITRP